MRNKQTLDKLGLAFVQLNSWVWSDYFGEKPLGFDDLPLIVYGNDNENSKAKYVYPLLDIVKKQLGERLCDKYWYTIKLHKSVLYWMVSWLYRKILKIPVTY